VKVGRTALVVDSVASLAALETAPSASLRTFCAALSSAAKAEPASRAVETTTAALKRMMDTVQLVNQGIKRNVKN
jgi:hypothetical protein